MNIYRITFDSGFEIVLPAKDKRRARSDAKLYVSEIGYGHLAIASIDAL